MTTLLDTAVALQKADDLVNRAERDWRVATRTRALVRMGIRTGELTMTVGDVVHTEKADLPNLFSQAWAMVSRLTP